MSSQLTELQKIIGSVIAPCIVNLIQDGDLDQLEKIGLSNRSCKLITSSNYQQIVDAIGANILLGFDDKNLSNDLVRDMYAESLKKLKLKWICHGASFLMCKHFFSEHSSIAHTNIRKVHHVDSKAQKLISELQSNISKKEREEFFDYLGQIYAQKKRIVAKDVDHYYSSHNLTLGRLWLEYKRFFKEMSND